MKSKIVAVALSCGLVGTVMAGATPPCTAKDARIVMQTSMGNIVLQLNPEKAPISVKNFCHYVQKNIYNNTIFHRVIANFMIQGGGFDKDFKKVTAFAPIENEAKNTLYNDRGSVAMARTSVINSATNQFFINLKDNDFLNHSGPGARFGYAVFGKVVQGMNVVDAIAQVPTGRRGYRENVPLQNVVIEKVSVVSAADVHEK